MGCSQNWIFKGTHFLQGIAGGLEVPALVGVYAQADLGSYGGADFPDALHVFWSIFSQLDLDDADAICLEADSGLRHFLRSTDTDGKVGLYFLLFATQVTIERLSCGFGGEVVEGYVEGAFDGGIESGEIVEFLHAGLFLEGVFSFPDCGEVFGHFEAGRLGLADDHGEGGAFADTIVTGIGMDADEGILGAAHGAGRDGERMHGDAELVDIGSDNFHFVFLLCVY
jgi:hypothetical protein